MSNMVVHKGRKLNSLIATLPEGAVVDAGWLERHGYGRALRSYYGANGWLTHVARGAFRKPGVEPGWREVVSSLQVLAGVPAIVGGRTALEARGLAHYLRMDGRTRVELWSSDPLPSWVAVAMPAGTEAVRCNPARLFESRLVPRSVPLSDGAEGRGRRPDFLVNAEGVTNLPEGPGGWPLAVSSPERAAFEMLDGVPGVESFGQADDLFGGLATLSPGRISILLAGCRSVKVKRLFLWLAHRHAHPWLRHLRTENVDLGSGKRMLMRDGVLDTRVGITVPREMAGRG